MRENIEKDEKSGMFHQLPPGSKERDRSVREQGGKREGAGSFDPERKGNDRGKRIREERE